MFGIETFNQRLEILRTHRTYLLAKRNRLIASGKTEESPEVVVCQAEIDRTVSLITFQEEVIKNPTGRRVEVLKSKVNTVFVGSVGIVKYVSEKHNYSTVVFPEGNKHSMSLNSIQVIDMPPLPLWIPQVGMKVMIQGNPNVYRSIFWTSEDVQVLDGSLNFWHEREQIAEIIGLEPFE